MREHAFKGKDEKRVLTLWFRVKKMAKMEAMAKRVKKRLGPLSLQFPLLPFSAQFSLYLSLHIA